MDIQRGMDRQDFLRVSAATTSPPKPTSRTYATAVQGTEDAMKWAAREPRKIYV